MDIKQENTAIDQVRELLKSNRRGLEALDFLEGKSRQYKTTKRYTHIMYLAAVTNLFVSLYLADRMYQSNCEIGDIGVCLFSFIAIVGTGCIVSTPPAILDTYDARMSQNIQIDFINDLLSEYATFEDFPVIKAGDHYYIDLPDGMRKVSPENVPYDEDTPMIGREYRYQNLC